MRVQRVLFLCRGNSCRSIMAEAIFNSIAASPMRAMSAGSHPSGKVNPEALATLKRHGLSDQGYRSKGIDEFIGLPIDVVITLCDESAGEVCPVFIGQTIIGHWGIPDPTLFKGAREEIIGEFDRIYCLLRQKIKCFLRLPFEQLNIDEVQEQLQKIEVYSG